MNSVLKIIETESYDTEISKVIFGDFRLNAEYYAHDNNFSLGDTVKTVKLSELADIVWFGPFKRYWIKDPQYGILLVSSSEMMEIEPSCKKYISKEFTKDFEKYMVFKNTILVSCSGTIGNVTLVDSRLDGMALSQDSLRVIPKEDNYTGLLYTFLSSEYGRFLTSGKQSGAVINHIYEEDLNILDIPLVAMDTLNRINEFILKTFKKRELANQLLTQSRQLILEYNHLPPLDEAELDTLDPDKESDLRLVSTEEFTDDYRLDAHFYSIIFINYNSNIRTYPPDFKNLSELITDITLCNRFTRNFVNYKNGVALFGTKDMMQIRPTIKYISKEDLPTDVIVQKNWILLARVGSLGGTFGKVAFVYNNFEGKAASDNIIRIIPDLNKIDPGYLYAYLSSYYGYNLIIQTRFGALQDALDQNVISKILIPIPSEFQQREIGDLVRQAYDLRAEAIRLEDEAQDILTKALTGKE